MAETTELGADVVNHARQQADEYRGDNPRPLGGYIVTMSTYAVIVAVSAVVAAVTGRKLPDRWRVQDLITVALGTLAFPDGDQGIGDESAARAVHSVHGQWWPG